MAKGLLTRSALEPRSTAIAMVGLIEQATGLGSTIPSKGSAARVGGRTRHQATGRRGRSWSMFRIWPAPMRDRVEALSIILGTFAAIALFCAAEAWFLTSFVLHR
jgi:hypothetical protein